MSIDNIPDQLTDVQARKIIEENANRARSVNEQIIRSNERAQQGAANKEALLKKARETFGTDDPAEMKKIHEQRLMANAQNVKSWLTEIQEKEEATQKIRSATSVAPR